MTDTKFYAELMDILSTDTGWASNFRTDGKKESPENCHEPVMQKFYHVDTYTEGCRTRYQGYFMLDELTECEMQLIIERTNEPEAVCKVTFPRTEMDKIKNRLIVIVGHYEFPF